MRFVLTVELQDNKLPIEYRSLILSYIKNTLSKCNDGKYFDKFFKDTIQKDYCFSVILPKSKFTQNYIELQSKEIKIAFTTDDRSNTGFILFNAFIAQKNKAYKLPNQNYMVLKSINKNKREEIVADKAIFRTTIGSAICVRDHNRENNSDNYYIYSDENFSEMLNKVLKNQLIAAGFTEDEAKEVIVKPIQCKKVVVKHYRRYIDTTVGMLQIKAEPYILQYLYDSGIGSRKSSGFGMLDLFTQDLI